MREEQERVAFNATPLTFVWCRIYAARLQMASTPYARVSKQRGVMRGKGRGDCDIGIIILVQQEQAGPRLPTHTTARHGQISISSELS